MAVELREGDNVAQWRHVAKDGADLPSAQAQRRPAFVVLGPGEIHDVEFTPRGAAPRQLRVAFLPQLRPPPVPPAVTFPPIVSVTLQTR